MESIRYLGKIPIRKWYFHFPNYFGSFLQPKFFCYVVDPKSSTNCINNSVNCLFVYGFYLDTLDNYHVLYHQTFI